MITQLASSLGMEKAEEVVRSASDRLDLKGESLRHEQAMDLLEAISQESGLVGIAATLAMSRLHFARVKTRLK